DLWLRRFGFVGVPGGRRGRISDQFARSRAQRSRRITESVLLRHRPGHVKTLASLDKRQVRLNARQHDALQHVGKRLVGLWESAALQRRLRCAETVASRTDVDRGPGELS